jgi:tRNA (guanine37-N1)-methyltransferase
MFMLGVKVKIQDAEFAKSYLIRNKIMDFSYKPIKKDKHLIFPILSKENINDYELIDIEFEQKISKNYKLKLPVKIQDKLPNSYDIIGEILIIDLGGLEVYEQEIAKALLDSHKSVKTILKKSGIHQGEFRTQPLSFVAGVNTKETIYKENNIRLKLDVENVFFSPRLSTERKRIFSKIKKDELVLVMFSGCGPYPITISRNTLAKQIIGIEKNPIAHKYAIENLSLNKIKNIELINADVRQEVPKINQKFDRIIMPLPKDADTFLDLAFMVSKKRTIIHLYDFEHESELELGIEKIKTKAKEAGINYEILDTVKCGQYGPGKFRICIDFKVI